MERLVRVRVTTGARRESFSEKSGVFYIAVKEEALQNAANDRVREIIAKLLRVPVKSLRIRTGHRSPNKTLVIRG